MWVKLIVSVTVLPMLVHSILGCCWHHAHFEVKLECAHSTTESHRGHHQHDHRSEHKDPDVPVPWEHEKLCDDVDCVYLGARPARNVPTLELHERVAALNHSCGLILNATVIATASAQQPSEAPLPSQRCALTQVWVV